MADTTPHIELYQGKKRFRQAWRWRAVAANGDILADSSESYTNKADMVKVVEELFPDLSVIEEP